MNQYYFPRRAANGVVRLSVHQYVNALAAVCLLQSGTALAQTANESLSDIVVTGNPLGSGVVERTAPSSPLSGSALQFRRGSTLGETLSSEVGVSSTYYGPNSSRPIIRGLDGDRVRILQNGEQVLDASSVSYDHASAIDPLVAERIEVIRGPAALLYGGNASGGIVNVTENRIPTTSITSPQGRAELRAGSADRENSGSALVEAGNGDFAVHADGFSRRHEDVRIPGFARSARQRAVDGPAVEQPRGVLPNTFNRTEGGALGGSMTLADGYAGLSVSSLRSSYGTPAEPDLSIQMQKETVGMAVEVRKLSSLLESVRFRLGHSDYQHVERVKETGQINTTFKTRGYDGRLDVQHGALGRWRGTIGVQFAGVDFSALGDDAFVPQTRTATTGLFLFEEARFDPLTINVGARSEHTNAHSQGGDGTNAPLRLGPSTSRSFNTQSAALGGLLELSPGWRLAANLAHSERAPSSVELFANGPHGATGTYEQGDSNFRKERSNTIDIALRYSVGMSNWSLGAFQTNFANYILLAPTGSKRAANGQLEAASTPGVTANGATADLPEYQYRQVPARFRGIEMAGKWRVWNGVSKLDLDSRFDSVQAIATDTGQPLPRITPMRVSLGAFYQFGPWAARTELLHAFTQNRVTNNESSTAGYSLLNALLSYRFKLGATNAQVYLRGNNLLNVEARSHTSVLKDIAPLPGRNLVLGLQASF